MALYADYAGEFELAERFYHEAVDLDRQEDDEDGLVTDLLIYSELLVDLGRLADAETAAHEALEVARRADLQVKECNALWALAATLDVQGEVDEALAHSRLAMS